MSSSDVLTAMSTPIIWILVPKHHSPLKGISFLGKKNSSFQSLSVWWGLQNELTTCGKKIKGK
jgi:hypothetical protein